MYKQRLCQISAGKNVAQKFCDPKLAGTRQAFAWIADIFKHDLVSGSFIPPIDIRQLRDLFVIIGSSASAKQKN
jgi:hypothetical protein